MRASKFYEDNQEFVKNDAVFSKKCINECRLSEGCNYFSSYWVFKMIILEAINSLVFDEVSRQEAQDYLERCLSQDFIDSHFGKFLSNLSRFLSEDISSVKGKLKGLCQVFIDLAELQSQIDIQSLYLGDFVSSLPKEDNSLSEFDKELLISYFEGFLTSVIEYNFYLSKSVDSYWLYFPVEIQDFIKKHLTNMKLFSKKLCDFSHNELLAKHQNSVSALEASLSSKIAKDVSVPKFSLSQLELDVSVRTSTSLSSCSSTTNRKYNLDDMLNNIKPENRHDTIDWGEPYGEEVW